MVCCEAEYIVIKACFTPPEFWVVPRGLWGAFENCVRISAIDLAEIIAHIVDFALSLKPLPADVSEEGCLFATEGGGICMPVFHPVSVALACRSKWLPNEIVPVNFAQERGPVYPVPLHSLLSLLSPFQGDKARLDIGQAGYII